MLKFRLDLPLSFCRLRHRVAQAPASYRLVPSRSFGNLARAVAVAAAILTVQTAVSQAAARYYVELFRRGPCLTEAIMDFSGPLPNPPVQIGPQTLSESCGANSFALTYAARDDLPAIDLDLDGVTYSEYVVGAEYWLLAGWDWDDVVFTCQPPVATVDARLFLNVIGAVSGFYQTLPYAPKGRVEFYVGHPQYLYTQGIWRAQSNNGYPELVSTGVFAGSTGDALNQTVSYLIGEPPSPLVPTGTPVRVQAAFTLVIDILNERVVGDFTVSLPTNGPVFDLPPGCTCNSAQMHVVNNLFDPGTTPVQASTWGRIKSLYR